MSRRGFFLTALVLLLSGPMSVSSQMTNGIYTLRQETVASSGGTIGGGNPMRAVTALGLPAAGRASNGVFTLIGGIGVMPAPTQNPITLPVTITGTINDPSATVGVSGVAATISAGTFTANGVVLSLGQNTITAVAMDATGNSASRSMTVWLDLPAARKIGRFSIAVTGTVTESGTSVSVNGVAATVSAGTFTATVPLTSGLNTLTATATDIGGNSASAAIHVFVPLPTSIPARPTVGTVGGPLPVLAPAGPLTIGGTKTAGTSIWINGVQGVPRNDNLTWSATVTLVEGDNEFLIIAKDAAGTPSAAVMVTIVVDNAPPVVTFTPPAKWNLTPALLSGQVDDHLTTVTINDVTATRTGRNFQVSVPLGPGVTPIILVATSPNGYTTTKHDGIALGTIPIIVSADPADRFKPLMSEPLTIRLTATDQEGDPIQYRITLDGAALVDWSSGNTASWTPLTTQFGPHVITVNARDGFGGERTQDVRVFVIRRPIEHP